VVWDEGERAEARIVKGWHAVEEAGRHVAQLRRLDLLGPKAKVLVVNAKLEQPIFEQASACPVLLKRTF
jgi:hypothetical protein